METTSPLPAPSSRWALFLDVDGTLIDIAEAPDKVVTDRRLAEILSDLAGMLGGAVALVSGRRIETLDHLFAPVRLPAAGLHGLERRDADGATTRAATRGAALGAVRNAFRAFAGAHPGVLIEDKEMTIALHYRGAPDRGDDAIALATKLIAEDGSGLKIQRGKMVVEIRPDGPDKGSVIETFMAEPPFAGRIPVFVGDDVTDEDGFEAVNRMGGQSVRVGRNGMTAARSRVDGVDDLLRWLSAVRHELAAQGTATVGDQDDRS